MHKYILKLITDKFEPIFINKTLTWKPLIKSASVKETGCLVTFTHAQIMLYTSSAEYLLITNFQAFSWVIFISFVTVESEGCFLSGYAFYDR